MSSKKYILDLYSTPYVFVYGTLKRGFSNNYLLRNAEYVGDAVSATHGQLKSWGPPCFVPEVWLPEGSEALPVRGELWKVTDWKTLEGLDMLEGHPHGYYRAQIPVDVEYDISVEESLFYDVAWCYFYDNPDINQMCPVVDGHYEWMPKE